jgi:Tol biopolymer transport system component
MNNKRLFVLILISLLSLPVWALGQTSPQLFQQALLKENGEGDLNAAVALYEKIVGDATAERELRAKAQLHIGMCWEKMGKAEAIKAYQKVIQDFSDHIEQVQLAKQAIDRLETTKVSGALGLSLHKITSDKFAGHQGGYISPSGRYVVYGDYEGGLSIFDTLTKEKTPFTKGLYDYLGAWSPDDRYVAYATGEQGVYIKSILGKESVQISTGPWDYPIMWNDEGEIYYYSPMGDTSELYKTDIRGENHELIKIFNKEHHTPSDMSKNMRYFVYSNSNSRKGVHIHDNQTNKDFVITTDTSYVDPVFSPDLQYIAVRAKKGEDDGLFIFSTGIVGKEIAGPVKIVSSPALKYSWAWTKNNELCFGQRSGFEQLYICDALGNVNSPLTGFKSDQQDPSWSPNGKQIVFVSDVVGKDVLWIASAEGGEVSQLTKINDEAIIHCKPCWSPDGSEIVYVRVYRKGNEYTQKLWKIDLKTKNDTQLVDYEGNFTNLCYSQDMTKLYFAYFYPSYRARLEKQIKDAMPDYKRIFELDLTNHSTRLITANSTKFDFEPIGFTSDNSKLLYQKYDSESNSSIWYYDNNSTHHEIMNAHDKYLFVAGISPDSKFIHVSSWNQRNEREFFIAKIEDGMINPDTFQNKELWPLRWSLDNHKVICKKENDMTEFWLARNIESAFANK